MIKVTVSKNENGVCEKVVMQGHAGFAQEGQDIVCAAVSMLFINTVNAIETFTDDGFRVDLDEKKGINTLQMTSTISKESKLLLDTMLLGFEQVQLEYGKKYMKMIYK